MSLILEALRKSEAERQRGRAPGLFVEQRPAHSRNPRVPAWAWGLGALLVAVLLAWGWREWQRPAVVVVATVAPSADTVTEAPPTSTAERAAPAPGEPASLAPITLAPSPATPSVALAPVRIEPAPAPVETAPAPAPAAETVRGTGAAPGSEAMRTPLPDPAPAATPAAEPATLPGLETLAASERSALPPLKLSMHVFAANAAERFVILDGKRLAEGASPAAGVVLEEIRRDGLVLSVNGQRLLLARP